MSEFEYQLKVRCEREDRERSLLIFVSCGISSQRATMILDGVII